MNQDLRKFAIRAGTGNDDRVWLGVVAPNKHRAIKLATAVWEHRVRKLGPTERLLVEVRT